MTTNEMYDKGLYTFPPPPVCSAYWNRQDWINYISLCGKWITPEEREKHEQDLINRYYAQYSTQ
jgi:hypothetical protein